MAATGGAEATPKISVYCAQSLDGFIARGDGGLDWLEGIEAIDGEDYGFRAFMDSVDVLVMGRHTYEKVLSFGGEWPYGEKWIVVLSSRDVPIPSHLRATVSSRSGTPDAVARELAVEGARHAYLDGGITIQRFLASGLVDELIITTIPVLLGEGRPLFGTLETDIELTRVDTRTYSNGIVQSTYRIDSKA